MWWISLTHNVMEAEIPVLKDQINKHYKNPLVSMRWEDLVQPVSRILMLWFAEGKM